VPQIRDGLDEDHPLTDDIPTTSQLIRQVNASTMFDFVVVKDHGMHSSWSIADASLI
jgi:hypothetical protein